MLMKGFFLTEPANPQPYANKVILNLSGAQKYEGNKIFAPGQYKIEIQAGASKYGQNPSPLYSPLSGKIITTINVYNAFKILAYCGSRAADQTTPGTNPYVGEYKVNGSVVYGSNIPYVSHIFGNAGSCCRIATGSTDYSPSSGNCLGDGARSIQSYEGSCATGAGSCLHLLPKDGVFGQDYLFAFHTTAAAASGGYSRELAGSGSAYGGAGSGCSNDYTIPSRSYDGGSTPYGTGGAGVSGYSDSSRTKPGNNGTGIGHGFGGGVFAKGCYTPGAAAYFDGNQWVESDLVAGADEDGKIKITYLGPLFS